MNYISILFIVIVFIQFSECLFLFQRREVVVQPIVVRQETTVQKNNDKENKENEIDEEPVGVQSILPTMMRWMSTNKPEMLPVLTEFAIANPKILRLLLAPGDERRKRDVESQVQYSKEQMSDPEIIRRVFEFAMDHDYDDCFKKYVCSLTKQIQGLDRPSNSTEGQLPEDNEPISLREECSSKFSNCSYKDFKTRDVISELSDREVLRQMSESSDLVNKNN